MPSLLAAAMLNTEAANTSTSKQYDSNKYRSTFNQAGLTSCSCLCGAVRRLSVWLVHHSSADLSLLRVRALAPLLRNMASSNPRMAMAAATPT
jgi:hypothetical protein